jgi:transmembrane sensor
VPNEPIQEATKDQAVAWFLCMQTDQISVTERREFLRWLNENPQHKQAYDNVGQHWEWLEPLKNLPFTERQEALKYQARRPYYQRIITYAAVALIVCALGLPIYWQQVGLIFPKTYQVAIGERQAIRLADGTRMDLNTDSAVKVQITPWRRDVELLRGEVYFQVAYDNKRPFRVKAGQGLIQDIGTAFEVYRQPGKTLVAVQEGIVDVETKERRRLTANQQLAYTENGEFLSLEQQAIDSLTAWRHGQLVFHARRLDDALAEIARYHSKKIRLEDNKLAALRISGAFPSARLDGMLNAVTRILPVRIVQQGDAIVIKRAGKPKA